MKKRILLFIILVVSLFTVGCGEKAAKGEKPLRIGVTLLSFDNPFQLALMDGMKEYAESLDQKIEFTFVDPKGDSAMQVNQVENFITQGVDAIIVVPTSTEATDPISKTALEAKIPLVYLNIRPVILPDGVYYVGSEEKVAGELQMEFIADKLNGKGNIAIMQGDLLFEAAHQRTEGVEEVAAKYPGIKIIAMQNGKWERPQAMTVTENWISSGQKIDAIIANNDEMAIGSIKALEANNLIKKVLVTGIDATPDAVAELEKGTMAATVFQDAYAQGIGSVDVALELTKGEKPEKETWIPFKLVTKATYKEIMGK